MVRPSVRPRLVEEGVPIGYFEGNTTGAGEEETMEIEPMMHHRTATYLPPTQQTTTTSSTSSLQQQSSLLRAAGGSIRSARRSTKIVIGGESSTSALECPLGQTYTDYPPETSQPSSSHLWNNPAPTHGAVQQQQYSYTVGGNAAASSGPSYAAARPMQQEQPHYSSPEQQYSYTIHHAAAPPVSYHPQPGPTQHVVHHHHNPAAAVPQQHRSMTQTHIEIGAAPAAAAPRTTTERMEGVEDHGELLPLVVLDGANVAYAYAEASGGPRQPDMRGLYVAWRYWTQQAVRVSIVVPQPYLRDGAQGTLWCDHPPQYYEQLRPLMVAAPSRDDDDAYALQLAQRENQRALERSRRRNIPFQGPAYVVSNDRFRDAQQRDASGQLGAWLDGKNDDGLGAGRISYTFCDVQRMNDYGEPELDFLPNARHALVQWMEQQRRAPQQL